MPRAELANPAEDAPSRPSIIFDFSSGEPVRIERSRNGWLVGRVDERSVVIAAPASRPRGMKPTDEQIKTAMRLASAEVNAR